MKKLPEFIIEKRGWILTITLVITLLFIYKAITITQSTLPVAAVGIVLGVDYGIYMLGRILEEYRISQNLKGAIDIAMTSVGEPVVFTAIAMTAGIIFWVFSPLMFQAYMGFFLAIILLSNMMGALFLVTSLVAVIKPRFIVGIKIL